MRVFSIFFFLIGCGVHNFSFGQKKTREPFKWLSSYRKYNYNLPNESIFESFIFFNKNQEEFSNYISNTSYKKDFSETSNFACADIYKLDTFTFRTLNDPSLDNTQKWVNATNFIARNHKTPIDSIDDPILRNLFAKFDYMAMNLDIFPDSCFLDEDLVLIDNILFKLKDIKKNELSFISLTINENLSTAQPIDTAFFKFNKKLTDSFVNFILPQKGLLNSSEATRFYFDCNTLGIKDSSVKNKRIPIFSTNNGFLEILVHDVNYDTLHYLNVLKCLSSDPKKRNLQHIFDSIQLNSKYYENLKSKKQKIDLNSDSILFFSVEKHSEESLKLNYNMRNYLEYKEFVAIKQNGIIEAIIKAQNEPKVVPSKVRVSFYYYEKIKPTESGNKTNPKKR